MDLPVLSLISILVVKIYHVYSLLPCPESLSTAVIVKSCPRTKWEWEFQANKKACSKFSQSCVKPEDFLYHCLINEYINMTIEVCAPQAIILGQKCAEFNSGGAVIQDNVYAKCDDSDPPCPFRYNSTELYKYQRCYSYIKSSNSTNVLRSSPDKTRDQKACSCDENVWPAVSVVFIILFLISCGFGGVLYYKYRNLLYSLTFSQKLKVGAQFTPIEEDVFEKENSGVSELQPLLDENKEDTKSCVCSIYIGDKYCGMAYLDLNYSEDIVSLGNHEIIGVLLTKDGQVKEFGDKAREMFTENKEDCSDYIFLDHDKLDIELRNEPIQGILPSMKMIDLYQSIIGFLVRKIVETVAGPPKKGTSCKSASCLLCNMHCVITVPFHWRGYVRDLRTAFDRRMKEIHKNVKKEQLHIKLREVAISPYIHEVKASATCLNFNVDNLIFKENTTYVNLHVGSKYCNLTLLCATDPKRPDRIIGEPYRQKWENSKPEVQFLNRLKEVFTEAIFEEWKEKYYWEYISLLWHFEDQKIKMWENLDDNEKYVFKLSSKLFKPFKEDQSKMVSLKDRLKKPGKELEMNESDCSIVFKWSYLKTFFTDIKEGTRNMIQGHKNDLKEVRCVIMTGSFSRMKLFLHEAEKVWFKELSQAVTVVIPVHIGSTYAMGAAYFFKKYPKWIFYDLISK